MRSPRLAGPLEVDLALAVAFFAVAFLAVAFFVVAFFAGTVHLPQ